MCMFVKQKSRLVFLKNLQSTHTLVKSSSRSILVVFKTQSLIKGISSEHRDPIAYTAIPNSCMHCRQHGYLLVQLQKQQTTWYPGKIIKITASLCLRVVSSIVLGQLNVISFLHFESAAGAALSSFLTIYGNWA